MYSGKYSGYREINDDDLYQVIHELTMENELNMSQTLADPNLFNKYLRLKFQVLTGQLIYSWKVELSSTIYRRIVSLLRTVNKDDLFDIYIIDAILDTMSCVKFIPSDEEMALTICKMMKTNEKYINRRFLHWGCHITMSMMFDFVLNYFHACGYDYMREDMNRYLKIDL